MNYEALADLTEVQKQTRDFIVRFRDDRGFPPTLREICDAFDITLTAARDRLILLERKGIISREPHWPRAIKVLV